LAVSSCEHDLNIASRPVLSLLKPDGMAGVVTQVLAGLIVDSRLVWSLEPIDSRWSWIYLDDPVRYARRWRIAWW
jgi:hypothetical protein